MPNAKNRIWLKILLVFAPMLIVGLVAWGRLNSEVKHNTVELDRKASRETVTIQYEAILRELKQLRVDVSHLHGSQ